MSLQLLEEFLRARRRVVERASQGSKSEQQWIVGQRAGQRVEVVVGGGILTLHQEGLQDACVGDSGEW